MLVLSLALAMMSHHPQPHPVAAAGQHLTVRVDSAHHNVILTAGSYDLEAGPGTDHPGMSMGGMGGMDEMMPGMSVSGLLEFDWPVDGWARGVKLKIVDGNGNPLPRRLIHHVNVVNFARRQLLYPMPERMIALGQETEDIHLPSSVGIPVSAGMPMALLVMWDNESAHPISGVTLEMTIEYLPANMTPRPLSVLPLYMDVVWPVAHDVDFDLPAGKSQKSAQFTFPLDGRIIGVGGHEHDFGTGITLYDVSGSSPHQVVHLTTHLGPDGRMLSIQRQLPGITGSGIRLRQGHVYRLVGTYDNTTGKELVKGAMIHMACLFAPDHVDQWPAVPANDSAYQSDMARLEAMGVVHGTRIR
jgi:hypothetical protein